ncbi:MAG: NADH:flavin oxidoreductase/NADH oxidase [Alphaproteobacteria bacterium]
MTSPLFQPLELRGLTLNNRIVVAPMCQYSADNGDATDWHMIHLGQLALSGSGLAFAEATAADPRGRITPECLGLWSDENEAAMTRVVGACHTNGVTPLGIQIGHAGRKASVHAPQRGGGPLDKASGAWQTLGPSAIPFDDGWHTPKAMDRADMDDAIASFVECTKRAARAGFVAAELHCAHGYLCSSFLSPIANRRNDAYGGDIEGRMKFPLEAFEAMRAAWPDDLPLGVRMNGVDWDDRGLTIEDAIAFAQALKSVGCDFFDISGGGNSPGIRPDLGPAYQANHAAAVEAATGVPTMAVGMIRDPKIAEDLIRSGKVSMVALARGLLYEPKWPWRAAFELGEEPPIPAQHGRGFPTKWRHAFPELMTPAE